MTMRIYAVKVTMSNLSLILQGRLPISISLRQVAEAGR